MDKCSSPKCLEEASEWLWGTWFRGGNRERTSLKPLKGTGKTFRHLNTFPTANIYLLMDVYFNLIRFNLILSGLCSWVPVSLRCVYIMYIIAWINVIKPVQTEMQATWQDTTACKKHLWVKYLYSTGYLLVQCMFFACSTLIALRQWIHPKSRGAQCSSSASQNLQPASERLQGIYNPHIDSGNKVSKNTRV